MKITEKEVQKLISFVKEAGNIVESYYSKYYEVTKKSDGSLVTQADIDSNKHLCNLIRREYPNTGLVTEELDKEWKEYTFAIDPLDGTGGFIKAVPEFTVMIGLLHLEAPVFGIIYNPITKELFYGGKDVPAEYTDSDGKMEKLQILPDKIVKENILSISNKATYELVKKAYPNLQFEKYIRTGSEGLRLMNIAKQKANLRVERRNGIFGQWDVCAPQAILEATGGAVLAIDGLKLVYLADNPFLQTGFIAADSKDRATKTTQQV